MKYLISLITLPLTLSAATYAADTGINIENVDASSREESLAYFDEAAKVFQHPRCLNCHPAGDQPTQGADLHKHLMNVQRGKDNHGAVAMKCATCHGDKNNENSRVPGAPNWQLAPRSMAWQGLTKAELCRLLKDPAKTHMTPEQFIAHNAKDKLVGWGWRPGSNREPVPGTQAQFGQNVANWIKTGSHCPAN